MIFLHRYRCFLQGLLLTGYVLLCRAVARFTFRTLIDIKLSPTFIEFQGLSLDLQLKGYGTPTRIWYRWVADPPGKKPCKFEGGTCSVLILATWRHTTESVGWVAPHQYQKHKGVIYPLSSCVVNSHQCLTGHNLRCDFWYFCSGWTLGSGYRMAWWK